LRFGGTNFWAKPLSPLAFASEVPSVIDNIPSKYE
jgi:hypothetical protein